MKDRIWYAQSNVPKGGTFVAKRKTTDGYDEQVVIADNQIHAGDELSIDEFGERLHAIGRRPKEIQ